MNKRIACRKRRRVYKVHAAVAEFVEFAEFKKVAVARLRIASQTHQNRVNSSRFWDA